MNEELVPQVEKLASLGYSKQQVATMLGLSYIEVNMWMEDRDSSFFKAYWKGYYTTDIRLRESILKLALAGSSPAQTMSKRAMDEALNKNAYEQ